MAYKRILIPKNEKQKRITIPKELGFKPDDEIIILNIKDYEILNTTDNTELLNKIKELENTINTLENDNKSLKETLEAKANELEKQNENINNLLERNNNLTHELEANKFNKQKLDQALNDLIILKESVKDKLNNIVLANENTAIKLLNNLDNDYKNINFIDRVLNRMSNNIDLTKYTEEIKQAYNKELENTKADLLLTSGNLENDNNIIDPDNEK